MASKIGWTDQSWNWAVGCSAVSPGCANCYAVRTIHRLVRMGQDEKYGAGIVEKEHFTGKVKIHRPAMLEPLYYPRPSRVFTCSMADAFHELIETDAIADVFAVMLLTPWHRYQVLTKRIERACALLIDPAFREMVYTRARFLIGSGDPLVVDGVWPPRHVMIGTSIEDQQRAGRAIYLRAVSAFGWPVFISFEPLLGPVRMLAPWLGPAIGSPWLDWAIIGGESRGRPLEVEWIEQLLADLRGAGVPVFVKQVGTNATHEGEPIKVRGFGTEPDKWPESIRWRRWPRCLQFGAGHAMQADEEITAMRRRVRSRIKARWGTADG